MTTLVKGIVTLTLPDDLEWVDEWEWSPVVMQKDWTLSGAAVIESSVKQSGKPITLAGSENRAWLTRANLETLQAWAAIADAEMTLTLPGRSAMPVMFDLEKSAIDATPILSQAVPASDDLFWAKLYFFEI